MGEGSEGLLPHPTWGYKNNSYIAPQAATAAAVALLCHRAYSPHPQTLTYDQTVICSPGLPFNGLHSVIHVITWITIHLPTLEGWTAELAWLVDP